MIEDFHCKIVTHESGMKVYIHPQGEPIRTFLTPTEFLVSEDGVYLNGRRYYSPDFECTGALERCNISYGMKPRIQGYVLDITVDRSVNRGGRHEIGQSPPISEQSLRFTIPPNNIKFLTLLKKESPDVNGDSRIKRKRIDPSYKSNFH